MPNPKTLTVARRNGSVARGGRTEGGIAVRSFLPFFFAMFVLNFWNASRGQDSVNLAEVEQIELLEQRIAEIEYELSKLQAPAPAEKKPDPKGMKAGWGKNGFEAVSNDGNFSVHVGGRVQLDGVALQESDLVLGGVGTQDAVDFRRARFRIDGTMYKTMAWATEFDWANGFNTDSGSPAAPVTAQGGNVELVPAITDMWVSFGELPWIGNLKVGSHKQPIGLEHLCSSRFLDFMERSYLQDAFFGSFDNGFTPGICLYDWNDAENVTAAFGAYKNTQNFFGYDTGDNEYSLTGRMTCVPLAFEEDSRLLHVGCAASYRGLDQDAAVSTGNVRVRSRASLRNGPGPLNPNLADTNFAGRLFADNETLIAPEIALVYGPWLWQAEYVAGFVNDTTFTPIAGAPVNADQVFFQGHYAEVLYFLTGEHRAYERHDARFGRVVPNRNAAWNTCGFSSLGAWQIGARYGYLDLDDSGIDGGTIQDLTVGLNWFLNPFAKLQFNFIHEQVENIQRNGAGVVTAVNDGSLNGFGVRFAQDF